jgi:Lipocalin-like domain
MKSLIYSSLLSAVCALLASHAEAGPSELTGAWTLVAADVIHPDGSRTHDYGDNPKGLLLIDADGHYSLQIYNADRPKFASGDKFKGTAAEYSAAVLGASNHFGTIIVDPSAHTFTLSIESSSYPNQEGTQQKRAYVLKDAELSYRVPARPDGTVPQSIWRRLQ